ncbi:MAG: ATPase [Deltaproteobacteria bacterium]|nr:ATPase [Deltaproteobacteria bacterium]
MKGTKKYSPKTIKKAIDTYNDPYLPKEGPHDMAVCKKCHAIYHNKRWSIDEALYQREKGNKKALLILCPACQKIRDRYAEGFVILKGDYLKGHKKDILNLIKNEEERATGYNPLERIIEIKDRDNVVEITTTHEKLAQRIGKKMHKACQGDLEIKMTQDRVTRVVWER